MGKFDSLYRKEELKKTNIEKILCILEEQDELIFIKRIYEVILNKNLSCDEFLKKIKLSWGKNPANFDGHRVIWNNKNECNFQGGNIKGCKTPKPALEALEEALEDSLYKGIIIMFDKDCDEDGQTEKEILNILQEKIINDDSYILYTSDPCLEKEILIIIKNNETEDYINENYEIIGSSKCKWFKQNFRNIPKKTNYKFYQSCEGVINNLKKEDLENSSMGRSFIDFIEKKEKV